VIRRKLRLPLRSSLPRPCLPLRVQPPAQAALPAAPPAVVPAPAQAALPAAPALAQAALPAAAPALAQAALPAAAPAPAQAAPPAAVPALAQAALPAAAPAPAPAAPLAAAPALAQALLPAAPRVPAQAACRVPHRRWIPSQSRKTTATRRSRVSEENGLLWVQSNVRFVVSSLPASFSELY